MRCLNEAWCQVGWLSFNRLTVTCYTQHCSLGTRSPAHPAPSMLLSLSALVQVLQSPSGERESTVWSGQSAGRVFFSPKHVRYVPFSALQPFKETAFQRTRPTQAVVDRGKLEHASYKGWGQSISFHCVPEGWATCLHEIGLLSYLRL